MPSKDLSIIIVHTYELKSLRQTLRGIRKAAPRLNFEIIIVDNNPSAGLRNVLTREFPETRYIANSANLGFGGAMNVGIRAAQGEYILIFNPDIIVKPGSLEELKKYMDAHPEVGVCGPQLRNPDGSLQLSCYRLPSLLLPVYRRTPLGKTTAGERTVAEYLMQDTSHEETMAVDALIGAALFTRASALHKVGLFDERFFMYYEDNDLCRRFWQQGYQVVYHPRAVMVHYHRRASADGGLMRQLTSKFTWIHISSFWKYYRKYQGAINPREQYKHVST